MSRAQAFGRYELLGRISSGGMAEVFRARDPDTGALVALKRLLPEVAEDEEFLMMFEDEANIASQLEHPYIARMLDYGHVDDEYFIAFEYVDGKDVRTLFNTLHRRRERIPVPFVVYILVRIAEGLAYAHARKDTNGQPVSIVHRDVSPQNLLVSFDGDVKLIDFGIAKAAGKLGRTQIGSLKGKFGYMAPEQVRSTDSIDQRVDVFALGICGWELLTMERLFEAQNELLVLQKLQTRVIPPPSSMNREVPVDLDRIILKCLAKSPDERYRSARELYRDLNHVSKELFPVVTREQIAQYMRRVFQEGRIEMATNGGELTTDKLGADNLGNGKPAGKSAPSPSSPKAPWEIDATDGADGSGLASDLDVFESLGRKAPPRVAAPSPSFAPPPGFGSAFGAALNAPGFNAPGAAPSVPPAPGTVPAAVPPAPPPAPPPASPPAPAVAAPLSSLPPPPANLAPSPPVAQAAAARPAANPSAAKRTLLGIPAPASAPPPVPGRASLPPIPAPAMKGGATPPTIVPRGSLPSLPGLPSAPGSSVAPAAAAPSTAPSPASSAPPSSAPPSRAPMKSIAMQWDEDDDEATHIFDKSLSDEVARSLASAPPPAAGSAPPRGIGTLPPPSAPPAAGRASGYGASRPPSSRPPPPVVLDNSQSGRGGVGAAALATQMSPPHGHGAPAQTAPGTYGPTAGTAQATLFGVRTGPGPMESTALVRPHGTRSGTVIAAGAIAAAAAAGLIVFLVMPRVGRVLVNVADVTDAKGLRLNQVDIAIDGRKQCDTVPCIVDQVSAGTHVVKVVAPGFESQETRSISVEARRDTIVEFALTPTAPKVTTALKVGGHQPGVHLYVNDKDMGPLPQEVKDLPPGAVKVRLAGDRYLPMERNVTLSKDETLDLGAQNLKVLKGKATVALETPGAKVYVVSGTDRRELPTLPISVDIDTSRSWALEAVRPGFVDYKQPISFDDGQAEKSFTILLEPRAGTQNIAAAPRPAAPAPVRREAPAAAPAAAAPAEVAGEAFLNINSLPPSAVVLDGKPIGTTPRLKVSVAPGSHTVLFVNADEGLKKQITVSIGAGETKAAVAKLRD